MSIKPTNPINALRAAHRLLTNPNSVSDPDAIIREIERAIKSNAGSLVGMWLHTFNPDGSINRQGQIKQNDGEIVMVQLYSWLDGSPTNMEAHKVDDVLNKEKTVLYSTNREMIIGNLKHKSRRGELCGTVEEALARHDLFDKASR